MITLTRQVYQAMLAGNSDDYGYGHINRVAYQAVTESEKRVALCHDVVEDEFASYYDLRSWGLTETEINAVHLLNRTDSGLTYQEYIDRLVAHKDTDYGRIAIAVKCYDIFDHLSPQNVADRSPSGADRYLKALTKLVHAQVVHV